MERDAASSHYQRTCQAFRAKLVSTNTTATQSDWLHPGIMALVSDDESYVRDNTTNIFSSWNSIDDAPSAIISITIIDQPSCASAQMNYTSYACSNGSSCQNSSSGGYLCHCSSYGQGNPYILDGCIQDYNPKSKENCTTSCGPIIVPFPFGIEEGCFAHEVFHLNCTSGTLTVSVSEGTQYQVTGVSVEDGTLTAGNIVNGSNEKEATLVKTDNNGEELEEPMEDQFDFSMEYDHIVIKWAIANLTCETAKQKDTMYACRSSQSYCLNVTHGAIFMGYRCKCSSGFQGNPYLKDGCRDIDECSLPNYCNGTCQNSFGSYTCSSCPHRKEFDLIKRKCVTSVTQRAMTKCRYCNWNWMWPWIHNYCSMCSCIRQQVEERHPE
uniref:EGF-like domain-containing protein n=1 Tax=Aegilops tauschii subsp. strangulata TaxID=200361 RepID=A0A453H6C3_AEGTS